jgi:hypothetical protein
MIYRALEMPKILLREILEISHFGKLPNQVNQVGQLLGELEDRDGI